LRAETKPAPEIGGRGFFRQKRIGAGLDYKSVAANRLERSAASRAAFQQFHFERKFARRRELAEPIRRGEPGDSAAYYRNPFDRTFPVLATLRRAWAPPDAIYLTVPEIGTDTIPAVGGSMKEESPARWAAGAAAPAPAVRRRENLRSASFRDYAMGRWHGWPVFGR